MEALKRTLAETEDAVVLNQYQKGRLENAGEMDIHRFFVRYDAAKRRIPFGNVQRDQWQQLSKSAHDSVRPLSREFLRGLHHESSLFDKTLRNLLEPKLVAEVKRANLAAARANYSEQIDTAMLVIGRQVSLSPEQKKLIQEKLLASTDPPAMLGSSLMPLYFVLANMGDIEDEFQDSFNEEDWRKLKKLIEAGRTATR